MKWSRIFVIGGIVVMTAAGLFWAFRPQPIAVDTAPASVGRMVVTVGDEGVARIRTIYEISTPVAGELLRIPVRVGDPVAAGTILATLLPQESALLDPRAQAEAEAALRAAEDAVQEAQSELNIANSELTYWRTEAERKERLLERGISTLQVVQQARLELSRREALVASAEAGLEMRQHQLEQAQARVNGNPSGSIGRRDVVSPAAGQVLTIRNESGRSLPAGTPLMEIGRPDDLEIVVDLLSTDAVRVDVGAPAMISGWGGDRPLDARVSRIEPTGFTKVSALGVEEQRVIVHLDLLDPPQARRRLGHLYRVFVEIETLRIDDALLVPLPALFRTGNAWSLFAVEDGIARLRMVEIGARNAEYAQVLGGIAPGTAVILHPSDLLADGGAVAPR